MRCTRSSSVLTPVSAHRSTRNQDSWVRPRFYATAVSTSAAPARTRSGCRSRAEGAPLPGSGQALQAGKEGSRPRSPRSWLGDRHALTSAEAGVRVGRTQRQISRFCTARLRAAENAQAAPISGYGLAPLAPSVIVSGGSPLRLDATVSRLGDTGRACGEVYLSCR